jgi:hypothetical protein
MKLNVPEVLKVLLVDDWEAITKNNQARLSLIGHMRLPYSGHIYPSSTHFVVSPPMVL